MTRAFKNWPDYIGIPHEAHGRDRAACDCWGLHRLIYADELGIALPSYAGDYVSTAEVAELERLFAEGRDAGPWCRVDRIQPFDALLFRFDGRVRHVGTATDSAHFIQSLRSYSQHCRLKDHAWRRTFAGAWRHEALA